MKELKVEVPKGYEVDWVVGDGVLCKECYEYNEQLKK